MVGTARRGSDRERTSGRSGAPRPLVLLGLALSIGAAVTLGSSAARAGPARRFALLLAHNDGGPGTTPLRYAESDMKKVASILRELGGYGEDDVRTLVGRTAGEALIALELLEVELGRAKREEGAHTTLLVYYSGHGKDGDLRLGKTRLPLAVLKKRLGESAADIKLGIVDSCESGALTREKGGRRGPSFLVDGDDQKIGRGLVLITSSAENESSQESDELGGSFFTHYLTSGLRGDADESGDRRVTLGEVYAYAYHKTVNVTAGTRSGTQHPTYRYDLEGTGDLVLTDLSQGTSGVAFPAELEGEFLIFDLGRDQVAAEIAKARGIARKIALPPGEYAVKKRLDDHLRMRRLRIDADRWHDLVEAGMERVEFEDDYAKGSASRREARTLGVRAALVYQSFLSGAVTSELFPPVVLLGAGVDYGPVLGGRISIDAVAGGRSGLTLELGGLALAYDFFEVELGASLLWGVELGDVELFGGPRIAGLYLHRSFPADRVLSRHAQDHFGFSPALAAGASYRPGGGDFVVEAGARLGYFPFSVDENRTLFYGELAVLLAYRL